MTGTSLDGLDCVLARIEGAGLDVRAEFVSMVSRSFGDALRSQLRSLASGAPTPPIDYQRASRALGVFHADVLDELFATHADVKPGLVVTHGQTIWHAPAEHLSWQLFDPWPIVHRLRVPVCYDLRQADLIARGQGAPITPLSDWVMYRDPNEWRVVCNLGGICNVTSLPAGSEPANVTGEDLGPCNLLLDGLVSRLFPGSDYDVDGTLSRAGVEHDAVIDRIRAAQFFERPTPRTTGREDFGAAWLDALAASSHDIAPPDVLASAIQYIAQDINAYALRVRQHANSVNTKAELRVIIAGGGARNASLVDAIRASLRAAVTDGPCPCTLSDGHGIPIEAREAMGLAVLGALSQDGVPITLPRVTGATCPGVAGAWVYP